MLPACFFDATIMRQVFNPWKQSNAIEKENVNAKFCVQVDYNIHERCKTGFLCQRFFRTALFFCDCSLFLAVIVTPNLSFWRHSHLIGKTKWTTHSHNLVTSWPSFCFLIKWRHEIISSNFQNNCHFWTALDFPNKNIYSLYTFHRITF